MVACSRFIGMTVKMLVAGNEWEHGGIFYRKEDNKYLGFNKVAHCPYPQCNGFICVETPPDKEKKRFKLVGRCTVEPNIHTFSYNEHNVGYAIELNLSNK